LRKKEGKKREKKHNKNSRKALPGLLFCKREKKNSNKNSRKALPGLLRITLPP